MSSEGLHTSNEVGEVKKPSLVKKESVSTLQQSWKRGSWGRWTARILAKMWFSRRYGEVDHYLTQLLNRHRCFNSYLHILGNSRSPGCIYCMDIVDDDCHTFFFCRIWEHHHHHLSMEVCQVSSDTIAEVTLQSEDTWSRVVCYTQGILKPNK